MDGELDQLGERIAEQAAHLDAAMHRLLTDLREFDTRGGWYVQGAVTCAHWLAWRVGWDLVTARDHVRVAHKLAEFALIDDALRRGEVSYSKVRAMLRVATPENEALLLDHARLMTASQLEKLCRKYALVQRHGQESHPEIDEQRRYVRRRDLEDGMVKIEAVLHPEEAELVWTMLDHAASRLAREAAGAATALGGTARQNSTESAGIVDTESPQAKSDSAESPAAAVPCTAAPGSPAGTRDPVLSAETGDDESPRAKSDSAESPAVAVPCRSRCLHWDLGGRTERVERLLDRSVVSRRTDRVGRVHASQQLSPRLRKHGAIAAGPSHARRLGPPIEAIAQLDNTLWSAAECPLCRSGVPVVDLVPG